MADPPSFFVTSLSGQNSNPMIPEAFFSTHFQAFTKLKLTSDAFDRIWEVKLNSRRFAGGWKDFSDAHCLKDEDVLVFRHDGDMFFHVTPSGRSFTNHSDDHKEDDDDDDDDENEDDDDDDSEDDDDDDDDSEDETWDDESDSKNVCSKKKSRLQEESSSSSKNSCLLLAVTDSNLRLNRVSLSRSFARTNGLNKRCCEIDVMNQSGKSWVLDLRHNDITGQDFICGGWRSFCCENKLKTGFSYRFKLVRDGTRPLLRLCSDVTPEGKCSKPNTKANVSAKSSGGGTKQNKFLTVILKPYMLTSRQLRLSRPFARENGIKKAGEITLVDKNGVKWPSFLASVNEQGDFYMTKGWLSFCAANKFKIGETFTLEFVRGEDTNPMFKVCSKANVRTEQTPFDGSQRTVQASREEAEEGQEETETRVQKRARVYEEGGPSRRTQASNKKMGETFPSEFVRGEDTTHMLKFCSKAKVKMEQAPFDGSRGTVQEETETQVQKRARVSQGGPSHCTLASKKSNADPNNLQGKKPLQPCSKSDRVNKVRQNIVDTLTRLRRFRSELKIKEQNLEASLREIDALEKVVGINKILK